MKFRYIGPTTKAASAKKLLSPIDAFALTLLSNISAEAGTLIVEYPDANAEASNMFPIMTLNVCVATHIKTMTKIQECAICVKGV